MFDSSFFQGRKDMKILRDVVEDANLFQRKPILEKGFRARSTTLLVFLFVLMYLNCSMGGAESMNLILPALENTFGWAPADVAIRLGAIRMFSLATMFIVGTIMMKFGIRWIMVPASILGGLLVIAMANVRTLDQFVYIGIAQSFLGPAIGIGFAALAANWWVRSRGKALGIITMAFPLSTATFTIIGTKGIAAWGYTGFYTAFGIISTLVAITGLWLVYDKPENLGMSPDGIPFTEEEKIAITEKETVQSKWTLWRIIRTKELWAFAFAFSLVGMLLGAIMSQLIPIFTSSGISVNKALAMMSIAALAGLPLSYIWGWLDDKIGAPITSFVFSGTMLTGCIGMAYGSAENILPYYLAILCLALGTAGLPNLQQSLLAYLVGRKEFVNISRYTNILQQLFSGVAMAYVPVAYAYFGSYKPVFLSLLIFGGTGMVLMLFTRKSFDPERQEFIEVGKVQ
jgi:sugar phosphate permease